MQREIKFRAWDLLSKTMRRVSFIEFDAADQVCNVALPAQGVTTRSGYSDRFEERAGGEYLDLMQFTGLKDKNGKEIYEGDIIRHDFVERLPAGKRGKEAIAQYIVRWDNISPKFVLGITERMCRDFWSHENYEVIGNICENPELLN